VVIGGGGRGKLRTGYFVDYRTTQASHPTGVPLNNLLVTLMNCFGIGSGVYDKSGRGYGNYEGPLGTALPAASRTPAAMHTALPFLYTGPALG
jgi:hypothetical protein